MTIRVASQQDMAVLAKYDRHLSEEMLCKKIDDGQIWIAEEKDILIGWLRYGFFWDEIPFMNLLYVRMPYQRQGVGTALVKAWEQSMKGAGYDKVLTSTLEEETAQHFYRKLGYDDLGKFMPFANEYELILGKYLE